MAKRIGLFLAVGFWLVAGCGPAAQPPAPKAGPFYLGVRAGAKASWQLPLPEPGSTPAYIKQNADVYPEDTAAFHTWVVFTPWGIAWAAAPKFIVQNGVWLPVGPSALRLSPYGAGKLSLKAKRVASLPAAVTLGGKRYWVALGGLSYQGSQLIYQLHTVASLGAPRWAKTYRAVMAPKAPVWPKAGPERLKAFGHVALPASWTVRRQSHAGRSTLQASSPDGRSTVTMVLDGCAGCGLPQSPPSYGPSPFYAILSGGGLSGWHQVPGGEIKVGPAASGGVKGQFLLNGPGIGRLTVTVPKGEKGLMMAIMRSFRR